MRRGLGPLRGFLGAQAQQHTPLTACDATPASGLSPGLGAVTRPWHATARRCRWRRRRRRRQRGAAPAPGAAPGCRARARSLARGLGGRTAAPSHTIHKNSTNTHSMRPVPPPLPPPGALKSVRGRCRVLAAGRVGVCGAARRSPGARVLSISLSLPRGGRLRAGEGGAPCGAALAREGEAAGVQTYIEKEAGGRPGARADGRLRRRRSHAAARCPPPAAGRRPAQPSIERARGAAGRGEARRGEARRVPRVEVVQRDWLYIYNFTHVADFQRRPADFQRRPPRRSDRRQGQHPHPRRRNRQSPRRRPLRRPRRWHARPHAFFPR